MVFTIPIYLIDSPEKGHRSDLSDRGRTLNEVKGTEKGFIEEQISSLASQL
ncbi:hypothetical protein FACS1894176_02480 [Bacteroidia bacterium]|nr:hypothetical protein FACS1894176_02480 [Bacteroidia bacterium]